MSVSFCIITGGTRPEVIRMVIRSIEAQDIAEYEIIVAGKYHATPGVIYVEAEDAAAKGRLGVMRNMAVARTRYENIVMLDDDIILSPDWYSAFLAYDKSFDILTSQIRVPDGGRYYDHATVGGPKGHTFLADDEDDEYVYMTGGGGWVMRDFVARSVTWDQERGFYQEEDVDFSRRCQAHGFKISYNPGMLVYHADPTYTCIGRAVVRRKEGRSHEWILQEFSGQTTIGILKHLIYFMKIRCWAEVADYIRMGILKGSSRWLYKMMWIGFVYKLGGDLPGSRWSPAGDPDYLDAMGKYRDM